MAKIKCPNCRMLLDPQQFKPAPEKDGETKSSPVHIAFCQCGKLLKVPSCKMPTPSFDMFNEIFENWPLY